MRQRALAGLTAALLVVADCGADDASDASPSVADTAAPSTAPGSGNGTAAAGPAGTASTAAGTASAAGDRVAAGAPFPQARCQQNKAAGKIRYLSGFDFAATASI